MFSIGDSLQNFHMLCERSWLMAQAYSAQLSSRLELGSSLKAGEWTSDKGWQEVPEGPLQIPKSLPQIHPSSLEKVWNQFICPLYCNALHILMHSAVFLSRHSS